MTMPSWRWEEPVSASRLGLVEDTAVIHGFVYRKLLNLQQQKALPVFVLNHVDFAVAVFLSNHSRVIVTQTIQQLYQEVLCLQD